MNLAPAQRLATRIRDELAPLCDRIEIAGSIRRQRPEVGDVDLVCLPKVGGRADIAKRCQANAACVKHGEQYVEFRLANGFQLDLWFAHRGEKDLLGGEIPSNFATLLVCRTGSREFNIHLATVARDRGLHWNPHAGLVRPKGRAFVDSWDDHEKRRVGGMAVIGDYLDTPDEAAFFAALGMEFVKPEDRR